MIAFPVLHRHGAGGSLLYPLCLLFQRHGKTQPELARALAKRRKHKEAQPENCYTYMEIEITVIG